MPTILDLDRAYFGSNEIDKIMHKGVQLYPIIPGDVLTVFTTKTANGTISNGGRTFDYDSGAAANALVGSPILEPTYFEMEMPLGSGSSSWSCLYAGVETLTTSVPIAQWYGRNAGGVLGQTWSDSRAFLYGLAGEQVGSIVSHGSAQTDPVIAQWMVIGRDIWLRTDNMPGGTWVGGGDPALGTTPSLVMPGTDPIYAGASCEAVGRPVILRLPSEYLLVPHSGVRSGILA